MTANTSCHPELVYTVTKLHVIQDPYKIMKDYYVYIMASKRNGTIYTGVTSNLVKRIYLHRTDSREGFTKKYKVHQLVYFEKISDIKNAIQREKQIKSWKRKWKIELIEKSNPNWTDLYDKLI